MNPAPAGLVLPDDPPSTIARAIEENAIAGVETWAEWPGIQLNQENGLTWLMSDIPFFIFNSVLRCDAEGDALDSAIDRVMAQAKSRGVPLAWWLTGLSRPEGLERSLEAKGWVHVADLPAMAVDLLNLNERVSTPPGLSIAPVSDDESLMEWSRVIAEVNQFPNFAGDAWLEIYRQLRLGDSLTRVHFLARMNGAPVAACSLVISNGVAGLDSVSTLTTWRRRGIGTAMTLEALRHARILDYRVGTLFSSEMALEIYRRLGFREYSQGHLYIWQDSPPEDG